MEKPKGENKNKPNNNISQKKEIEVSVKKEQISSVEQIRWWKKIAKKLTLANIIGLVGLVIGLPGATIAIIALKQNYTKHDALEVLQPLQIFLAEEPLGLELRQTILVFTPIERPYIEVQLPIGVMNVNTAIHNVVFQMESPMNMITEEDLFFDAVPLDEDKNLTLKTYAPVIRGEIPLGKYYVPLFRPDSIVNIEFRRTCLTSHQTRDYFYESVTYEVPLLHKNRGFTSMEYLQFAPRKIFFDMGVPQRDFRLIEIESIFEEIDYFSDLSLAVGIYNFREIEEMVDYINKTDNELFISSGLRWNNDKQTAYFSDHYYILIPTLNKYDMSFGPPFQVYKLEYEYDENTRNRNLKLLQNDRVVDSFHLKPLSPNWKEKEEYFTTDLINQMRD